MASSAGLARTILYDVSDPVNPVPIPGGDFWVEDEAGEFVNYYFANLGGLGFDSMTSFGADAHCIGRIFLASTLKRIL